MKKIIAGSLIGCALFVSGAFASDAEVPMLTSMPTIEAISINAPVYTSIPMVEIEESITNDLIKKYEFVIRNNTLKTDYEYNGKNYYTSKLSSENIVVPDEIMEEAKKVYFLVEEGQNRIYFESDMMLKSSSRTETVTKEYNYKIVDYKSDQEEYIFNNKDLVKDFSTDEYKNVQITLIVEFSDTEKFPISNTAYVNIGNKKSVLEQLNYEKNENESFFGYYNSNDLETYLETISDDMKRSEYKAMLQKAEKKIKSSSKKNEDNMDKTLSSIKYERDFEKHVDTYRVYSETQRLLNSLQNAVKNQLQNVRAFDAIDAILK